MSDRPRQIDRLLAMQAPLAWSDPPAHLSGRILAHLARAPGRSTVSLPRFPWRAAATLAAACVILIALAPRRDEAPPAPQRAGRFFAAAARAMPIDALARTAGDRSSPLTEEARSILLDAGRALQALHDHMPRRPRPGNRNAER